MYRITRDHIRYSIDKAHAPVLEIDPGETVIVETYDARTGTIRKDTDLLDHPHPDGANPATGPVYVRGAEPGDALVIVIESIDLAPEGFLAVKAGDGLLGHLATEFEQRMARAIAIAIEHEGEVMDREEDGGEGLRGERGGEEPRQVVCVLVDCPRVDLRSTEQQVGEHEDDVHNDQPCGTTANPTVAGAHAHTDIQRQPVSAM